MATKKDLVEAYSYSRRRLVTAFVSGAPGGREVEPARPGRAVVGGIALAVLLCAGAAILGVFKSPSDISWGEPALLTDGNGALYVNLGTDQTPKGEESLHQVINVTSARLILGAQTIQKVNAEKLAERKKGGPIGILNAPATVPDTDQLINSGWTACTLSGHGIRVAVAPGSHARSADGSAFLVKDSDGTHVVAETQHGDGPAAFSYDLPPRYSGQLVTGLHLSPTPVGVSPRWTALLPPGAPLDASGLGLSGYGRPAPSLARYWGGTTPRIGDYFVPSGGQTIVVTAGGFVQASPFAAAVLAGTPFPGGSAQPRRLATPSGWSLVKSGQQVGSPSWPTSLPKQEPVDEVCAVLHDNGDGTTSMRMATSPDGTARAVGTAAGSVAANVDPGHGAVVRSAAKDPGVDPSRTGATPDTTGTSYLVDDRAFAYRIASSGDLDRLGYSGVAPVVVPPEWIGLFQQGVELSRDAALCPPTPTMKGQGKCS
ncbi:MAG: type VII secretion protein EccB [Nocardioidaceae bacterium]|nr:type VII secretion protein EccB [Nocardioidaceae bacterium]MCL2613225.1 type VII secretion protein EccB [Nocardioidaceae bacterium]